MDELIEKVQNTLEERNICIPENYDIKNILIDYDSIEVTDDLFEEIISKCKNINLICNLLNQFNMDFVEFSETLEENDIEILDYYYIKNIFNKYDKNQLSDEDLESIIEEIRIIDKVLKVLFDKGIEFPKGYVEDLANAYVSVNFGGFPFEYNIPGYSAWDENFRYPSCACRRKRSHNVVFVIILSLIC